MSGPLPIDDHDPPAWVLLRASDGQAESLPAWKLWARTLAGSDASMATRALVFALTLHIGSTSTCWPGDRRLGLDASISEGSVRRSVAWLTKRGWLTSTDTKPRRLTLCWPPTDPTDRNESAHGARSQPVDKSTEDDGSAHGARSQPVDKSTEDDGSAHGARSDSESAHGARSESAHGARSEDETAHQRATRPRTSARQKGELLEGDPSLTSTSYSRPAPGPVDNHDEDHDRDLGPVWAAMADREARNAGTKVNNPDAFRRAVRSKAKSDHEAEARRLTRRYPTLSDRDLAAVLAGERGILAGHQRRRCATCDDRGVIEVADGAARCPDCGPARAVA